MLVSGVKSVLVKISHQTQGGKFGVSPALSRNCDEIVEFLSQDARRFMTLSFLICEVRMTFSLIVLKMVPAIDALWLDGRHHQPVDTLWQKCQTLLW
jgi:hypothetical protein